MALGRTSRFGCLDELVKLKRSEMRKRKALRNANRNVKDKGTMRRDFESYVYTLICNTPIS